MENVTLLWHGPYKIEHLKNYESAYLSGVYAVYRKWGASETLLYIGKTERGFVQRLSEHYKSWLQNMRGQILVRCGIPLFEEGKHFSKKKLSDVEQLLISWHRPTENTISQTYYHGRDGLIVINKGRRGSLHLKVSSDDYEY